MIFDVLTLFPEMFESPMNTSLLQKAREEGLLEINTTDIRDFAYDRHRRVDDYPYGGGSGMLMKPEPVFYAHEHLLEQAGKEPGQVRTILLSPAGKKLDQAKVRELSRHSHLVLICGRYEGVDQRVVDTLVDEEISIGDYILLGGELPAMVIIEAVSRYIPGVIGNTGSLENESFSGGLLEYPQYTKPREFRGMKVPDVLLNGNHRMIEQWRKQQSLDKTRKNRPDLLKDEENDS